MSLRLTVHRGTQQIGGSCIEIAHPDGDRLHLRAYRCGQGAQIGRGSVTAGVNVGDLRARRSTESHGFRMVRRLEDGEAMMIP